jgi:hypothetical protein
MSSSQTSEDENKRDIENKKNLFHLPPVYIDV